MSEQHNIQAAAGWVGEGWNLSFGSISWAEHNSNSVCSGCANGWEDTWQLADPFGTSVELIPPNINVSTYFDDSANDITASPIRWHATPENYAKIYSYTGPLTLPDGTKSDGTVEYPPCFRVFLTNGIMEEFGCTSDSLEYYYTAGMGDYISSWNLDLITDPQGNQIHITYQQDIAGTSPPTYIRDAQPATVEWDSPSCHKAQAMCSGSDWAPQMRVQFAASYALDSSRVLNSPVANCNAGWHLRCDDPLDLSGSNGVAAPLVQSTLALQDALVQVRANGTGSWNTLKDYQFYYNQSGPRTTVDAVTGNSISSAGYFVLAQLAVKGINGNLPISTFGYTTETQFYEDSNFHAAMGAGCGPSWNDGACLLWSQSQPGNSYYLATYENGMGLHEDFSWQLARNNTHGVPSIPSGGNPADPLYCDSHQSNDVCTEADDQNWSRAVLTQTDASVLRGTSDGNVTVDSTHVYTYSLTYPLAAQECADCQQGMYWGNQNDGDELDYYNGKFMGFAESDVSNPDGSLVEHHYDATEGYGLYDASVPCLAFDPPCHVAPWWDVTNTAHGHEVETEYYDTNGTTLLRQDTASYAVVCPPSGIAGSPAWNTTVNDNPYTYTWDGELVSELDHGNPVVACDVQLTQSLTSTFNSSSDYARSWTNYSYDSFGRVTDATANANDGGGTGSPTSITSHTDYVWNDSVSANSGSASGHYLIDLPAQTYNGDPGNTTRTACARFQYDGAGYMTGQQSAITLGAVTASDSAVDCGNAGNGWALSGVMTATTAYDIYGNVIATTDPLGNQGNSAHLGCTINSASYTDCLTYDSTYHTQVVTATNTLGQITRASYAQDASGGFGLWPTSSTDANGNVTTTTYDGLGRPTSETLPGETSGLTTLTWGYNFSCGSGPQTPCVRVDETQRLNASATVATHAFYDGFGQLEETRTQAPSGQDVVNYTFLDVSRRAIRASKPYYVGTWDGTGTGYSAFDDTQPSSLYTYDGMGRILTSTDAYGDLTSSNYRVACNVVGGDSSCYGVTGVSDPDSHLTQVYSDAFGRTTYTRDSSGDGSVNAPYATYRTISATYDYAGNETKITQPNGSATSFSFDDAGRQLSMTDPDRGHETYSYDADGNLLQATDARNRSVFAGYDGLDRQTWRNSANTQTGAYVQYSYDDTSGGGGTNQGIGRLTGEVFKGADASDSSLSGSYSYRYDARGQLTSSSSTILGATYTTTSGYDDAGDPTTLTYPDGSVATSSYDGSSGWFDGLSLKLPGASTPTTLLNAVGYIGSDGAWGGVTSATLNDLAGNALYHYGAHKDDTGRPSESSVVRLSDNATLFEEQVSYDPAGNVSALSTQLPAGTDHQLFCYDEQNRLTWAGTTTSNPCGNPGTTGTFTGAGYSQSYSYDTLDRLTSGTLGGYTYGDPNHLHAATQVGSGSGAYTASYDASGDMVCRAPDGSTSCVGGANTGQQLTWDVEGRLANWQNTPTTPTSSASYLYDGEGQRVAQVATNGSYTVTRSLIRSYVVLLTGTSKS